MATIAAIAIAIATLHGTRFHSPSKSEAMSESGAIDDGDRLHYVPA
jgi:hypothetical protein